MRLDLEGDDQVGLATPPDRVHAVLADPVELLVMFGHLLDDASRPHRWVAPQLHTGPVPLDVVLDVTVEAPSDDRVVVRGRPVPGHTPATLDIDLRLRGGEDGTTWATSRWSLGLQVPGPQLLAQTLRPVVAHSSRRTTREIRARLRDRFGAA